MSGDWCADCLGRGEVLGHDDDDRDPVDAADPVDAGYVGHVDLGDVHVDGCGGGSDGVAGGSDDGVDDVVADDGAADDDSDESGDGADDVAVDCVDLADSFVISPPVVDVLWSPLCHLSSS